MNPYPSPCEVCTVTHCSGTGCVRWLTRYLYRQKQINAYARKVLPKPPMQDPCAACSINESCDTPCPARLKWWDHRMAQIRKQVGM